MELCLRWSLLILLALPVHSGDTQAMVGAGSLQGPSAQECQQSL